MTLDPALVAKFLELAQFLGIVTMCAGVLAVVYTHVGRNEPDRLSFAATIFVLTVAIGLLVSIIKQAPAISFGLFGAMSIVRFRTRIKQPQRMIFVFMAAAIGVCCGAGEYLTTIVGTVVLSVLSLLTFRWSRRELEAMARPAATLASQVAGAIDRWTVDFVPAALENGRRIRVLSVIDDTTRDVLALVPDTSFTGTRVVAELDRLIALYGKPAVLLSDSWPEFGSNATKDWKKAKSIKWQCTELSQTPEVEPFIASFARKLRDECRGREGFTDLEHARGALEQWRVSHNGRLRAAAGTHPVAGEEARPVAVSPVTETSAVPASSNAPPAPSTKPTTSGPEERPALQVLADAMTGSRPVLNPDKMRLIK